MNFTFSTQNVAWFRDRYRDQSLILKPPYQRKPVWAARQKCYLIESILLGLPVPEIYIQQTTTPDGQTTYAIVDGQQRIRAVLQFIGAESDPHEEGFNKFVLDKLEDVSRWKNRSFGDLSDDEKTAFYGYQFSVRYLNTRDDHEVRDMFRRLNKFLTPLKPQELRNATYAGPFIQLAQRLADNEYWAENGIVKPASIRRSGDVEFVSELLIGAMHGPQGGSAAIIDDYYQQYEDYEDEFPGQRKVERLFAETLTTIQRVVPGIRETRWSNKTDFYTLFVAIATQLSTAEVDRRVIPKVKSALEEFASEVEDRLADERARVSARAIQYVRAVEKGANDKKRRADRQTALLEMLEPLFRPRKSRG